MKDLVLAYCEDLMLRNSHEIFSPLTFTREKSSKANTPGVIGGFFIPFQGGKTIDFPFCAVLNRSFLTSLYITVTQTISLV